MKETLDVLNSLRQYIDRFEDLYKTEKSFSGAGKSMDLFYLIKHKLEDARFMGHVSDDMEKTYTKALEEIWNNRTDNYDNTIERINNLCDINNQQLERCTEVDKKMAETFSFNWKNDSEQVNDSKKDLQHIIDLIRGYKIFYLQNGAMKSVDMLCNIVKDVKKAVEEKTISENTAKAILKPLEHIRTGILSDDLQRHEIQNVNNVLQDKMFEIDENTPQNDRLNSSINSISTVGVNKQDEKNMQQTDVAKTQSEMEKTLKEQKLVAQEKSGAKTQAQEPKSQENQDKTLSFKTGIEKTKQIAHNRQNEIMALYMKKRKKEFEDY